MFKSKKWIIILFIVIALPILIINLPFLTNPQYSNDGKFILEHQDSIKKEIIENLDFEKKRIKSVTLLPGSASGEYDNGGDVSGNYHIYFSAYVNDNKEQSLRTELSFPDAGIAPFTFIHPNPYKDKSQDMSTWYMGEIEISEDSSWDWKREQDEAKEALYNFSNALVDSGENIVYRVQKERATRFFNEWLQVHQENFKSAIQSELYRELPELEQSLGKIQNIRLSEHQAYFPSSSRELSFDISFEKYPEEVATIKGVVRSQSEQSIFQDSSASASISFDNGRFVIDSENDSKLYSIFSKSRLGSSAGDISYYLPEDHGHSILIP
ncbi:hypothetical protein K1I94_04220 [Streptococcus sanguinis]|uniref:hypothetical protein n=1 Tax=Streptococcus sanguinis TaxID=1305 RepID=UPI001CBBEBFF|nr:hypothetical protein [Streptococcus sanguinis]MBZ2066098.1 hypothetical protein [Streptococcus sanguinis]